MKSPPPKYVDGVVKAISKHSADIRFEDGLCSGSTADTNDEAQFGELDVPGELTERAWAKGPAGAG